MICPTPPIQINECTCFHRAQFVISKTCRRVADQAVVHMLSIGVLLSCQEYQIHVLHLNLDGT